MKKLEIVPKGWSCTVEECPPGHFVYQDQLCFKTEYRGDKSISVGGNDDIEVFCCSGEHFCPRNITVQPVSYQWEEE